MGAEPPLNHLVGSGKRTVLKLTVSSAKQFRFLAEGVCAKRILSLTESENGFKCRLLLKICYTFGHNKVNRETEKESFGFIKIVSLYWKYLVTAMLEAHSILRP